jgi:flagellar biosynthesis protein FlhA
LLLEEVSIRDFERIAEALVESAESGQKDVEKLLTSIRIRIGRFIVNKFVVDDGIINACVLSGKLEDLINRSMKTMGEAGENLDVAPDIVVHLRNAAMRAVNNFSNTKLLPVLIVQSQVRRKIWRSVGDILAVIALQEIPESYSDDDE